MKSIQTQTFDLIIFTLAFAVSIAAWVCCGVIGAFLMKHQPWMVSTSNIGMLLALPLLSGSLLRPYAGYLSDKYGGRSIYLCLIATTILGLIGVSIAHSFLMLAIASLMLGTSGATFAVGVSHLAKIFAQSRKGTALGIFGMGNIGTALTAYGAPKIISIATNNGKFADGWRVLPLVYVGVLIIIGGLLLLTKRSGSKSISSNTKEWKSVFKSPVSLRLGFYYGLLFGGFVALSQWLIPYFSNAYGMTLAEAGLLTTCFAVPTTISRWLGGVLSDRFGSRKMLMIIFPICVLFFLLLSSPRMNAVVSGTVVKANTTGVVTASSSRGIRIGSKEVAIAGNLTNSDSKNFGNDEPIFPVLHQKLTPIVAVGQMVKSGEAVGRIDTSIFFAANQWVFLGLLILCGISMGIGMASVFKAVSESFPNQTGIAGGLVGLYGGLGGSIWVYVFGSLLRVLGIWSSCWTLLMVASVVCFVWQFSAKVPDGSNDQFSSLNDVDPSLYAESVGDSMDSATQEVFSEVL